MDDMTAARILFGPLPADVFDSWLRPIIIERGWNFRSPYDDMKGSVWARYLMNIPLATWQYVTWTRVTVPMSETLIHPVSADAAQAIVDWHIRKDPTAVLFGNIENGEERFRRCVDFVRVNKRFPVPVVLFADSRGHLVLDGNHRLAALYHVADQAGISPVGFLFDAWIGQRNVANHAL